MPAISLGVSRAEKIRRAILKSRAQWIALLEEKQTAMTAVYASTANEIRRQLDFYADDDGSVTYRRLQELLGDVQKTLVWLKGEREREIRDGIDRGARIGIESYERPLEISGYGAAVLFANFTAVHAETLEAVWHMIQNDGLQLSDRIWRLDRGALDRVTEVIESAVVRGQSARAAAESILRSGARVPPEILRKMGINASRKIGADIFRLFTPHAQGNVFHHALTLARTEISRASREGFLRTGAKLDVVVGYRWNLSPTHPKPDICDTYATSDPDGFGPGGYLKGNYPRTPAHPNCLCFDTPIFAWEVKDAA